MSDPRALGSSWPHRADIEKVERLKITDGLPADKQWICRSDVGQQDRNC